MKIDKDFLKSFRFFFIVIGILGLTYISIVFFSLISGSTVTLLENKNINQSVTGDYFTASNTTPQELQQNNIVEGSLKIYNNEGVEQSLLLFTVNYTEGTVLLN